LTAAQRVIMLGAFFGTLARTGARRARGAGGRVMTTGATVNECARALKAAGAAAVVF
jgi:hypothetical protein